MSLGALLPASRVGKAETRHALDAIGRPTEEPLFLAVRVIHPGKLFRRRKEIAMDKGVVIGKKNAESGVRVIPADNAGFRVLGVLHFVDMFPSVLRERDVSASLRCVLPGDAGVHMDSIIATDADQNAADFGLHVCM